MPTLTQKLANPTRFMAVSGLLLPWVTLAALALIAIGLVLAANAPPDYQQSHTVKIMFIHVPMAWLSMGVYAMIALSGAGLLIFRHPLADVSAKAAAPLGAAFTFLALVTGSLWGKPMWGTYWAWDPRLTSELVLLFLYFGYMGLRAAIEDPQKADKASAVLAIVGVVNVPIIRFSVDWWNSLHQPATRLIGESDMDWAMKWPLLLMMFAFLFYFAAVMLVRLRAELLRRERNASWVREVLR
jgi:heme exporter protein C